METKMEIESQSPVDSGIDEISVSGSSNSMSSSNRSISTGSATTEQDDTIPQSDFNANHIENIATKDKENTSRGRIKASIISRRKKVPEPSRKSSHKNQDMADKEKRLKTFSDEGWHGEISIQALADAGFYLTTKGTTVCYKCNLQISDWRRGDIPMKKHKKRIPKCEIVRNYRNSGNVEFDAKISSSTNTSDDMDNGRSGLFNHAEFYRREFNRLVSYVDWPLSIPVDRYDLASSGLYSIREHGESDAVKCFACYKVIKDWQLGDRPKKKHASVSPSCPFVKNEATGNQALTGVEKVQIASLFWESEGGSHSKKSCDVKDEEATSENEFSSLETVKKDPFFSQACYPKYYHENKRLHSFQEWPINHCQKPQQLADAGFFYTGKDDEVQCFYCGGKLVGWESEDIPLTEHITCYPKCKWILKHAAGEEAKFQSVASSSDQERGSDNDALLVELEKLQDRSLCKICLDGDADIVFLPCKHLAVCKECTERLELCPMCRSNIHEEIHVFMC